MYASTELSRPTLDTFSTAWRSEMSIVAGVGVGLHMGEVALGLVGPRGRQSMTMVGELLMSSAIAAALKDDGRIVDPAGIPIPFLQLPQFALRGREAVLDIWCVPAKERIAL
jgi:class 3 adenylate cyclase